MSDNYFLVEGFIWCESALLFVLLAMILWRNIARRQRPADEYWWEPYRTPAVVLLILAAMLHFGCGIGVVLAVGGALVILAVIYWAVGERK